MTDPFRPRGGGGPVPQLTGREPPIESLGRPPRLLAMFHAYPPVHNAGAEWMAHGMLRHLAAAGWSVTVSAPVGSCYDLDGVAVVDEEPDKLLELAEAVDVLVVHLDRTRVAVDVAARVRRPLVHLLHNHHQLRFHKVRPSSSTLAVANSRWLADAVNWSGSSVVVRPALDRSRYAGVTGDPAGPFVLVNPAEAKGGHLFWQLAAKFPAREFVAVAGAYGAQVRPPRRLQNARLAPHGPGAVRAALDGAAALLAPSAYESWGMAAGEALGCGIPVVASPTPGLVENLGAAGMFVEPDDLPGWAAAVKLLEDPDRWTTAAKAAAARAEALDVAARLDLAVWAEHMGRCATLAPSS